MKTRWVREKISRFALLTSADILGNCIHHDGFIFDNSAPELTIHGQSDMALELSRLESDMITDPTRRDELERQKTKFRWMYCDATVLAGSGTVGCQKGKHRCDEKAREGQQQQRSYLNEDKIRRWEQETDTIQNTMKSGCACLKAAAELRLDSILSKELPCAFYNRAFSCSTPSSLL
jgi:hypothetical protein